MDRTFIALGAVLAFLGVAAGAFGAHGLKKYFEMNPELHPVFKTAVEYQMYHSLALLAVAWAATQWPGGWIRAAGVLFAGGIVLFSGSLYAYALTGVKLFGAITPIGGLALLAGWLCLAACVWRR